MGLASVFLYVKRAKYGKRPVFITTSAFVVALAILIPLGNDSVNKSDKENPVIQEEYAKTYGKTSKEEVNEAKIELTQDELNDQLKNEAVQADYNEITSANPPNGKKVYVDGKIIGITKDVLDIIVLSTDDYKGMYKIQLVNTTKVTYTEGDHIRVYGTVIGKGVPDYGEYDISGTLIEQK